jgi:hypothetical protein
VKAQFKIFPSVFKSWEQTCEKVATFVEEGGPDRLIGVSHTAEPVAIVWYWESKRPERDAHGPDRS